MNPYAAAFVAAVCFSLMVFPWRATIIGLGAPGVFLAAGIGFLLTGAMLWFRAGLAGPLTLRAVGIATAFVAVYVVALLMCAVAFGHPNVNLPIATAITAAYPVGTALISVFLLGQRMSPREAVFFGLTVAGLVGMGLSAKPH